MNHAAVQSLRVASSGLGASDNLILRISCSHSSRLFNSSHRVHQVEPRRLPRGSQNTPSTSVHNLPSCEPTLSSSSLSGGACRFARSAKQRFLPGALFFGQTKVTQIRTYSKASSHFGNLGEKEYRKHQATLKPLSKAQIMEVFGPGVDPVLGNKLLTTLQKQRITGTLDNEVEEQGIDDALVSRGLLWLRARYFVDEDAAIIKRIENEEKHLEEQFIADAERFKIYTPQASAEKDGVYGKSVFEAMRKENERKEAIRKQVEEVRSASPDSAVTQRPSGRAALSRRTESAEWVKKYRERARLSKLLEPEEISKTRRLLPASIFTFCTIGLCVLFAQNYEAPPRAARIFPNVPPAAVTVLTIIHLNVAAFLMWRLPFFWRFMNKYFLLIPATPRASSLLGNTISHQSPSHLITNMVFLWFIGTRRTSPAYCFKSC